MKSDLLELIKPGYITLHPTYSHIIGQWLLNSRRHATHRMSVMQLMTVKLFCVCVVVLHMYHVSVCGGVMYFVLL